MSRAVLLQKVYAEHLAYIQPDLRRVRHEIYDNRVFQLTPATRLRG